MISESLLGIEELIVRTPGLLARLNSPPIANYELAKSTRLAWDYFDTLDEADLLRPFFVLQEVDLQYSIVNDYDLQAVCAVDVTYSEDATDPTDHKASKLYFVDFVSDMLDSIAERQGHDVAGQNEQAYVSVHRIQMLQQAVRSPKVQRDPDRPATDYWWCKWRMWIGEPEAV